MVCVVAKAVTTCSRDSSISCAGVDAVELADHPAAVEPLHDQQQPAHVLDGVGRAGTCVGGSIFIMRRRAT